MPAAQPREVLNAVTGKAEPFRTAGGGAAGVGASSFTSSQRPVEFRSLGAVFLGGGRATCLGGFNSHLTRPMNAWQPRQPQIESGPKLPSFKEKVAKLSDLAPSSRPCQPQLFSK